MAAAYAALVSLMNTMDQIQMHPLLSNSFNKYQNQSLRKKIDFLVEFVENYSEANSREAEDLVRQIVVVAREAEDIIEVHAAYRIRARSKRNIVIMPQKLNCIIKVMDSIREKAIKVKVETGAINGKPTYSMPPPLPPPAAPPATTKTTMVGFESYVKQLLDELTRHPSRRQILPIVGMGGIGKTALARNVYENLLMVRHFDVRAWITVSQEFSASEIISQALTCLRGSTSKTDKTYDQLGEELHKILYGRRYLIILDDVWSVEAWEKIKFFFPDNDNGSRIVVTTRQSELVDYFGSSALVVDFLDDKNSWDLFCEKTFPQKSCPPELKVIAKKIVRKCKGLPLAIIVIGGLLGKSPSRQEYWEKIAEDKRLILNSEEGNKPLSILYLSYKHLPVWLRSCFLYLGLFPEDYKIEAPQLIRLWVAEGFIKPTTDQSLEEVAENYMKDLVDRNLLLVGESRRHKRIKMFLVHDLVRDLCIEIAEKENFFCIQRNINGTYEYIVDERTARFYPHTYDRPSLIRPQKFWGQRASPIKSRLLRVLVNDKDRLGYTFRQVNLRFLHYSKLGRFNHYKVPSSISLLWSLQTLIFDTIFEVAAPSEIWKMPQLRHIEIPRLSLPNPPPGDDIFVLQNLQTLETVSYLIWTEDVCKRIPNVKELIISYKKPSPYYHLRNVGCLNRLESLGYYCGREDDLGYYSLHNLKLPSSLKKLGLENSKFEWSAMAVIGSLPHLEILELYGDAVVGPEWNFVEEKFVRLKYLKIRMCYGLNRLIHWTANSSNFPILETLILDVPLLEEIPSGFGEIPTLEFMCLYDSTESATISAVRILEEQENLGNEGLRLELSLKYESEAELWREKIKQLGITCQNLHIYNYLI